MLGWGMTVSLRPRWSEDVCVWGAAVRGGGRYVIVWSIVGMSVGYCVVVVCGGVLFVHVWVWKRVYILHVLYVLYG